MKEQDLIFGGKNFDAERMTYVAPMNMPGNHFHEHYEIYYQVYGERYYFVNDRAYKVEAGDIVLISEYELHHTFAADGNGFERILINFNSKFLSGVTHHIKDITIEDLFQLCIFKPEGYLKQRLEQVILNIESECILCKPQKISITYAEILMSELFILLSRVPKKQYEVYDYSEQNLLKAIRFIKAHYNERLSLDDISKKFFMSKYYFCHKFKQLMGITFKQYFEMVKINEARRLLNNTGTSIAKIAEMIGFDNETNFCRMFKKVMGISPLQYRNQKKED